MAESAAIGEHVVDIADIVAQIRQSFGWSKSGLGILGFVVDAYVVSWVLLWAGFRCGGLDIMAGWILSRAGSRVIGLAYVPSNTNFYTKVPLMLNALAAVRGLGPSMLVAASSGASSA